MANTVTQILHPSGARVFHDAGPGLVSIKYSVVGDGAGSTVDLPYDLITKLLYYRGAGATIVLTDVPASKKVTAVIPATIAADKLLYFELIGLK
jgi:hypothetical protein